MKNIKLQLPNSIGKESEFGIIVDGTCVFLTFKEIKDIYETARSASETLETHKLTSVKIKDEI